MIGAGSRPLRLTYHHCLANSGATMRIPSQTTSQNPLIQVQSIVSSVTAVGAQIVLHQHRLRPPGLAAYPPYKDRCDTTRHETLQKEGNV
ncbi:hypothetical protein J6590_017422 [Homalodisca vitripennis]|nr:hypothetical protein J6590_017422 [Homalodisca vitripennis]